MGDGRNQAWAALRLFTDYQYLTAILQPVPVFSARSSGTCADGSFVLPASRPPSVHSQPPRIRDSSSPPAGLRPCTAAGTRPGQATLRATERLPSGRRDRARRLTFVERDGT